MTSRLSKQHLTTIHANFEGRAQSAQYFFDYTSFD